MLFSVKWCGKRGAIVFTREDKYCDIKETKFGVGILIALNNGCTIHKSYG